MKLSRGRGACVWIVSALAAACCGAPAFGHPGIHHDIERVTAALASQPDNVALLIERGYYERLAGQFAASLADLDRAEKLAPTNTDIAAQRGQTLAAMDRSSDAERELTRFIDSGRSSAAVLADRARIRAKSARPEEAIADYSAALALGPDVEIYLERAAVEESQGRLSRAAAGLREGIDQLGGAIVLRERLVDVEVQRKQYDAALRVIDDQIAVSPVKTTWYLKRGDVLAAAGREAEAKADRQRALSEANRVLETRPTAVHLLSRARANLALGHISQALADARLAEKKAPKLAEARELVAQIESKSVGVTEIPVGRKDQ